MLAEAWLRCNEPAGRTRGIGVALGAEQEIDHPLGGRGTRPTRAQARLLFDWVRAGPTAMTIAARSGSCQRVRRLELRLTSSLSLRRPETRSTTSSPAPIDYDCMTITYACGMFVFSETWSLKLRGPTEAHAAARPPSDESVNHTWRVTLGHYFVPKVTIKTLGKPKCMYI